MLHGNFNQRRPHDSSFAAQVSLESEIVSSHLEFGGSGLKRGRMAFALRILGRVFLDRLRQAE